MRKTIEDSLHFTKYCNSETVALSLPSDQPTTLQNFLVDIDLLSQDFRNNIRAYNNAPGMGCVNAERLSKLCNTFTLNPTMTIHDIIYHYLVGIVFPSSLSPYFLSVYIQVKDYEVQVSI